MEWIADTPVPVLVAPPFCAFPLAAVWAFSHQLPLAASVVGNNGPPDNVVRKGTGGGLDLFLAADVYTPPACNSRLFRAWTPASSVALLRVTFARNAAVSDASSGGGLALDGGGSLAVSAGSLVVS